MKKTLFAILMLAVFALPLTARLNFDSHGATVKIEKTIAYAQSESAPEVAATPAPEAEIKAEEEVAEPNWFDAALKFLAESGGLLAGLAMVFEIVLRFIPTAKPKSILIPARYAFVSLAAIFGLLGDFVQVLIEKANNVKK